MQIRRFVPIALIGTTLMAFGGCRHYVPAPSYDARPQNPPAASITPVPFPGPSASLRPSYAFPQTHQEPPLRKSPPAVRLPSDRHRDRIEVVLGAPIPMGNDDRIGDEPPKTAVIPDQQANDNLPPEPPVQKEKKPTPPLPVGIPEFTMVEKGVAAGRRPMLDGGLDWLKASGYLTVLHILNPGDDDSSDRKQFEKRGIKYLRLETSPESLSPIQVVEFKRVVIDTEFHPLFVYDRDGSLAGGLWYLYLRTVKSLSHEDARDRAGSLGLRETQDGAHREMWLAVQNYLSLQKSE